MSVEVVDATGTPLPLFDTVTNGTGRWAVEGLPVGTYGFHFDPTAQHPNLPPIEYAEIVISAGEEVLRICPPLTITSEEIDAGLQVLAENWNMLERVDGD